MYLVLNYNIHRVIYTVMTNHGYRAMTPTEITSHLSSYLSMPMDTSSDDHVYLSLITPGELKAITDALPKDSKSKPSHTLLGPGVYPYKTTAFKITIYFFLGDNVSFFEANRRMPTDAKRHEESLRPGDYVEVLWPSTERVTMCKGCGGEGWLRCRACDYGRSNGGECVVCYGQGGYTCVSCDGGQGTRQGVILTLAKTSDDWFVVTAVRYSDYYNEDWDRDMSNEESKAWIADQLSGVTALVRSQGFQRFINIYS